MQSRWIPGSRLEGRRGMATRSGYDFTSSNERPEKPRLHGMTEIRGPYYTVMGPDYVQDVLESMGCYVDGLKFTRGSSSLMPGDMVKRLTSMAHDHGVYVSTGGWGDYVLNKGPGVFKQYVQECKDLGFDTIELNTGFLKLPEEDLLSLIRTVKNAGLKARPELGVEFGAPVATSGVKLPREGTQDANWLIRHAERCLQAGADMIMIEAEGITDNVLNWRTDVVSQIIECLGLEKTMFEAADLRVFEWFVKNYGSKVNLFVDHSQIVQLECLRLGLSPGTGFVKGRFNLT